MGFFSSKPSTPTVKKGPSADTIRRQEQERISRENLANIEEQEARRLSLRSSLTDEEDEIQKKRLFGE